MVFLKETKILSSFIDTKKFFFDFYCCLAMECIGRSRGKEVLWKKDVLFKLLGFSNSLIHSRVKGVLKVTRIGSLLGFMGTKKWINEMNF